jgi:hypothetical protein
MSPAARASSPAVSAQSESASGAIAGEVQKVGLLFVHGIGQQTRWEHLRSAVVEIAELLGTHGGTRASVSVVDRTGDWQPPPGEPDIASPAPITVSLRSPDASAPAIDFECHEVWWADLGKRRGLIDSLGFWVWGLGQWCAPIYSELDASGLTNEKSSEHMPIVRLPRSVAEEPGPQHTARIDLAWAGLGAALAAVSISLFKRVAGFVSGAVPSSTLIVDYVGDVQTYQERASPGRGLVSDPGHPRRVAIRRRMVSEMIAMGARGFDRWYVFGHSLGSVVAFNGISEIGHTLPNYLSRALWDSLPDALKVDDQCALRSDIEKMMPSRPAWLANSDCINRPLLFEKLAGFVTYGSPLDKFAALWPRIVAVEQYGGTRLADDPARRQVFPRASWINIISLTDPVAGHIERYRAAVARLLPGDLPTLTNVVRPRPQLFGLSHILYFAVRERSDQDEYRGFYDKFFIWLTRDNLPAERPWYPFTSERDETFVLRLQGTIAFLLVWLAATGIVGLAAQAVLPPEWTMAKAEREAPLSWALAGSYLAYFAQVSVGVLALATVGVYLCGVWRWMREQALNRRLALYDAGLATTNERKRARLLRFVDLAVRQVPAARAFLMIVPLVAFVGLVTARHMLAPPYWMLYLASIAWFGLALSLASRVQAWLTRRAIVAGRAAELGQRVDRAGAAESAS